MEVKGSDIVSRIKECLVERGAGGENNRQLCKESGISPQDISHWKVRGTIPRADELFEVAKYLGVSPRWLLTGEHEKNDLDNEEANLLAIYRNLETDAAKRALISGAHNTLKMQEDLKEELLNRKSEGELNQAAM